MAAETAQALLDTMLASMDDSYQKTIGYPTYDILAAFALSLADTNELLEEAIKSLDPDNLSGDDLAKYVYQRRGIQVREATCASAVLEITGVGTIERGTVFETEGGLQFEADEDTDIYESGTVAVTCVTAGSSGNVGAGTITRMPVTITGIVSCTNSAPATGGYDRESDADLLDRFYVSLRDPGVSGNIAHYKQWAREVPGVGLVRVYPLARGANTVEVLILDDSNQPADETLIAAVQEYIDPGSAGTGEGAAPIGAHCYVTAPETLLINISVAIVKNSETTEMDIKEAIEEQVSVYLADICMVKDAVSYGKICAAVALADGVEDFAELKVNGVMTSIDIPEKTAPVLGEVEINYVT